jgi:hypothetical protein
LSAALDEGECSVSPLAALTPREGTVPIAEEVKRVTESVTNQLIQHPKTENRKQKTVHKSLALLLHIQKVPDSNFDPETGYRE